MGIWSFLTSPAFLEALVIGVAGAAVLKMAELLYKRASRAAFAQSHFDVSGIWATEFNSYIVGKRNIEVVRLYQDKERVSLQLQQFTTANPNIKTFRGEGVMRGNSLAIIYYAANRNDLRSGVLLLTAVAEGGETVLKGRYGELDIAGSGNVVASEDGYILRRAKIPFLAGVRLALNLACFRAFDEAEEHVKEAIILPSGRTQSA